ncbi:MAG: CoA-binding protein [Lutibacter sp.]|nr:CoA-binding protein [Lutibacter sp.]
MKTLVLGASTNPSKYSYLAINRLVTNGYKVYAIGTKEGTVGGVKITTKKKIFTDIDTVTLYVSAKNQADFYNYIIGLKPRRVLFNPGTENPFFERLLTKNNIEFERACTLVLLSLGAY